MNVGYNSVFDNIITFDADSTLESANVLVTLTDDGKAKKAGAGDDICGYAVNLRGDICGVQVKGYMNVPQDGTVKCGLKKISADAQGRAALNEAGREVLVIFADGDTAGIIL